MTCLLYWLTGFRGEDFKTFFPIGSYVKTTVCPLKAAILDGGQGRPPSKMAAMSRHSFNIEPYGSMGFE
jgi:hypothetical protein